MKTLFKLLVLSLLVLVSTNVAAQSKPRYPEPIERPRYPEPPSRVIWACKPMFVPLCRALRDITKR